MNKQKNNLNHPLNKQANKFKEISKDNKSLASTAYSKNKKALDQMLREYQSFCKKYFGESTPIGSMTEERMNKLLEDQENKINQNQKIINFENEQFFDIFKDKDEINENEEFLENNNILDELPNDLPYCQNNRLGNHKNTKNDYERRNKILFKENVEIKEKEIKKEEEKNDKNEDEYDDFEKEENIEDIKNGKARIIQKIYRKGKIKNKERIYFGYDKSKNNILWIYSDKIDSDKNINSIIIKCFNIIQKNEFIIKKNIKELLNLDSISKEKIQEKIEDIIGKLDNLFQQKESNNKNKTKKNDNNELNKYNEEKVVDEDGEEYTF